MMTINWWTMALQAINFLVLVWLLQRFLYKPVLTVIAKRKQLVEQAFIDAEAAKKAASADQQQYQQAQQKLVQERQDLLKQTHAELETERVGITEAARSEAAAALTAAHAQIEVERSTAFRETRSEVADLAVAMAGRLLQQLNTRTSVVTQLDDIFLGQMTSRVQELAPEERQALSRNLETAPQGLQVVTAEALSESQQQSWREMLEAQFGVMQALQFIVEPALIGGVELRFPHAVLSLAWSELLQQEKQALLSDEIDI